MHAARAIVNRLNEFNEKRKLNGEAPVRIGSDIHHGSTMLGTLGEAERMETTVISDAVNLAARLESLSRRYGVIMLISGDVYYALDDDTRELCREIDLVRVKGKNNAASVFEVMN